VAKRLHFLSNLAAEGKIGYLRLTLVDSKQHHVFFVDDEPDVRSVVQKTLGRQGIKVTCFASAADCLRRLRLRKCSLLITDVKMPDMDGLQLLAEAKRRAPWLPVLVVTGYGDIPTAVRAVKAGATDFIEKPLERESFLATVESLLGQPANCVPVPARPLTRAEAKVLQLVLEGRSSREIASVLHRAERTVETHRRRIMQKFGADNIVELVRRAALMGLAKGTPP
jgi:two-component system response regulator FixJ